MNKRRFEQAFALPTVVITAVILMMLLVGGLSSVTSVRRGLNEQYYASIAREAAEAGLAYAQSCITKNLTDGASSGWGFDSTTTLKMGMNCSGAYPSGVNCDSAPTVTPNQCYVYYDPTANPGVRSSFAVGALQTLAGGSYTIKVTSSVSLYNGSGAVYKSYPTTQQKRISVDPHVGLMSGNDTSCSIQYGNLYCWGRNDYGQVGIGTTNAINGSPPGVLSPAAVGGALTGKYVHAVATGINHTCAVTGPNVLPGITKFTDGSNASTKIYCWGDNSLGQFGNTSWTNITYPEATRVLNMTDHYATAISGRDFNCIIANVNATPSITHNYCWGDNNQKQAGRSANCSTASDADTPDPKPAFGCQLTWANATNAVIEDTIQVNAVTSGTACGVIASEGQIMWCKGNGSQGTLGNGGTADEPRAVRVRDSGSNPITGVIKVATNNGRACALATYGSPAGLPKLFCWGSNWDSGGVYGGMTPMYQIDSRFSQQKLLWATQMQTNRTDTTYVFYNRAVSDFAISDWNTCFISAGVVYCAGYNDEGQLGQGHLNGPDGLPSISPGDAGTTGSKVRSIEWAAPVGGALSGKTVVSIVGGNNHFCVSTSENDVYCWGENAFGQLGDGTTTNRTSPVKANVPKNIVY